ncbi:unnamed protein product [Arabis nemorensis]|uniref:Pentacotripeptide-repeat region of PRORP domain-containing protein n=1 Tax=Arabis nemorensis TaxID=586526 RepID=A0A565BYU8_9BRAS|nr:unnamed protein product [Arabis nemorensis]
MSLIRRVILGRRFCTAVPRRAEDVMSNPDCRPFQLSLRVMYLSSVDNLDTAAKYARLAVFSRIKAEDTEAAEDTEVTCQSIIKSMVWHKRHKEAYDLYDFFFNQHKLKPNRRSCNSILESRIQQGLVDEALDFHRSIKPGMARYYPSEDTFRVLNKGLVNSGRLDQAETLLKGGKAVDRGIYPDHVAFSNLIRGFLDLGNLDKATLVLEDFKKVCSRIDPSSYYPYHPPFHGEFENRVAFLMAAFVEYWFKQGKEMEAMECYNQSLFANKFPVLAYTGDAFLEVLLKYGKKKHAWDLYHGMLTATHKRCFGYSTVKTMVNECFDMGRCSEAVETYNKAKEKKRFVRGSYVITRCCEMGLLSEAESLIAADGFEYIEGTTFKTMMDAYVRPGESMML